ncbi:family 2 glycosyl transferase [Leptolyngbya sp. 'hensonii']|uniref:glycosyltransferase family 2 protein n=1 Tax=Leptolyngbya sp. 'hensonii' TaxID=1922337 RepID=UPI00094F93D2|nr:glycosyltransferase family A protein [Leptolyngbya sp. 'hensonii']OLP18434.1 family 2 glycosyl transferase [Leptolyngbya sp. 'hensonii']
MKLPLITIALCTYNRAESLRKYSMPAIEQVTYPNYEVIVVDDHSPEPVEQVLHDYPTKIEHLSILRNGRNRGLPFSRNRALAHAQGSIIVFMDDDVSPFPDCLDEIAELYINDPDLMFTWGCVYQCHGSHDWNAPTFGTGSLFSLRQVLADYFQFDTNIRYFKTYGCEEHDLARRVQRQGLKIVRAEKARANHYQAPAKDRKWRGLGGDLNFLYEALKTGSVMTYYVCLLKGIIIAIKRIRHGKDFDPTLASHPYKTALETAYLLAVLLRDRKFATAAKWLFYVLLDIPIRASIRGRIEAKQASGLQATLN